MMDGAFVLLVYPPTESYLILSEPYNFSWCRPTFGQLAADRDGISHERLA